LTRQDREGPDDGRGPATHRGRDRVGRDGSADGDDGRGETPNQRLDRNWVEILQELRVTQTGIQILTGFLLAIAFQPSFDDLETYQQRIYLVLVLTAVLTTALGLAPVSLHRALFRRRVKLLVVRLGHLILRLVLLGVGLVLVGTVLLVFDVVAGLPVALAAAGLTAVVVAAIGALPALLHRARGSHPERRREPV
jgi:hypothetical protein